MDGYRKVDLFGGAIVVDLPDGYADVSDIRQVPDHQEVYLDKDGFASIIIDITERPDSVTTDEAALELHLDDIFGSDDQVRLWYQNRAQLSHFPEQTPAYTVFKTKHFPRENSVGSVPPIGSRVTPVFTGVLVTIIRLETQKTDIVVTINVPHMRGSYDEGSVDLERGQLGALLSSALAHQDRVFSTLEVKDWSLFVQE
ncbi:MAG: multicopy suppressor of ts gsp1 [Trichoglossum hirsutum]|nr:MAG: multicopy suppressor of ts gsp1 [Trichoglossum hirsutum]